VVSTNGRVEVEEKGARWMDEYGAKKCVYMYVTQNGYCGKCSRNLRRGG
jgi:hypothetical protein